MLPYSLAIEVSFVSVRAADNLHSSGPVTDHGYRGEGGVGGASTGAVGGVEQHEKPSCSAANRGSTVSRSRQSVFATTFFRLARLFDAKTKSIIFSVST